MIEIEKCSDGEYVTHRAKVRFYRSKDGKKTFEVYVDADFLTDGEVSKSWDKWAWKDTE